MRYRIDIYNIVERLLNRWLSNNKPHVKWLQIYMRLNEEQKRKNKSEKKNENIRILYKCTFIVHIDRMKSIVMKGGRYVFTLMVPCWVFQLIFIHFKIWIYLLHSMYILNSKPIIFPLIFNISSRFMSYHKIQCPFYYFTYLMKKQK